MSYYFFGFNSHCLTEYSIGGWYLFSSYFSFWDVGIYTSLISDPKVMLYLFSKMGFFLGVREPSHPVGWYCFRLQDLGRGGGISNKHGYFCLPNPLDMSSKFVNMCLALFHRLESCIWCFQTAFGTLVRRLFCQDKSWMDFAKLLLSDATHKWLLKKFFHFIVIFFAAEVFYLFLL